VVLVKVGEFVAEEDGDAAVGVFEGDAEVEFFFFDADGFVGGVEPGDALARGSVAVDGEMRGLVGDDGGFDDPVVDGGGGVLYARGEGGGRRRERLGAAAT
jgi:hypothetical protein